MKQRNNRDKTALLVNSVRRTWTINPVTRVVPNKKIYSRKKVGKVKEDEGNSEKS